MKKMIALYVVLGILVTVLITGGAWAWKYYTAHWSGKVDAEQKIESGNSQISNYNHYFDLCSVAKTRQQSLKTQKNLLEMAEDSKEKIRVRSNIAGLESQLNRSINQYNVDARKEYTMARFKDSDLPFQLNFSEPINCN